MTMNVISKKPIVVSIEMAGDIDDARRYLRQRCYDMGLCVTVTATTFIYTGGEEAGFKVGICNYPRFPTTYSKLIARALALAGGLVTHCCQRTALVTTPKTVFWIALDPPGMKL